MGKDAETKLTAKQTVSNAIYAMKLAMKISPPMIVHSFFLWLIGYGEWVFFDGVFMKKIVQWLDEGKGFRSIFLFIAVSGAVFCIAAIYSSYVENVVYPLQTNRLFGGIYRMMYDKARNVELKCYEDSDFYNRYTMAMDGAEEKVSAIARGVLGTIIGSGAVIAVFYLMFRIDHWAILFILSPLIGNFVFGNLKNKFEYKRYLEQVPNEKVLNYVNRMMYLPDGAKEIRLSNIFGLMRRQYADATEKNVRTAKKFAFPNATLNFFRITFTFTVIFEGVLLYAIYRNKVSGTVSLAELTIMTSLMVAMTWTLIDVFENILDLMKNAVFINNFRGFLEYVETIPQNMDGTMPDPEFESLEFRNVTFAYKEKDKESEPTIRNLSFTVRRGQMAALVGHNGAGKTTIIKLLLRMYDPDEGAVFYNGKDIREYNLKAYRELFAATFQDFAIFGMSVKDNVLMGRHFESEEADREHVKNALIRAGAYERVCRLENGMDTIMTKEFDEKGAVLSGGESQKIAVARTFVKEAPVKIFDEPSSALDPIAEYDLFRNIMKEGKDHTMLFISHRLSSVKNCDRVFMLEKGTLIEEGRHEELMAAGGEYARMYEKQAMNYLAIDSEEVGA